MTSTVRSRPSNQTRTPLPRSGDGSTEAMAPATVVDGLPRPAGHTLRGATSSRPEACGDHAQKQDLLSRLPQQRCSASEADMAEETAFAQTWSLSLRAAARTRKEAARAP